MKYSIVESGGVKGETKVKVVLMWRMVQDIKEHSAVDEREKNII